MTRNFVATKHPMPRPPRNRTSCGGDRPRRPHESGRFAHPMKMTIIEIEYPRIKAKGEDGRIYTIKIHTGWEAVKLGLVVDFEKVPKHENLRQ